VPPLKPLLQSNPCDSWYPAAKQSLRFIPGILLQSNPCDLSLVSCCKAILAIYPWYPAAKQLFIKHAINSYAEW